MSAATPFPSSPSAVDKRAYEPSMEEILASIRRIIADDQSLPGRVIPPPREPDPSPSVPVKREPIRSTASAAPASPAAEATMSDHAPTPAVARPASPAEPDLPIDSGMAHGSIAAPQFAMPDGPVSDGHIQQREQARVAFQALHGRDQASAYSEATAHQDPVAPEIARPRAAEIEPQQQDETHEGPVDPPLVSEPTRDKTALFSDATDSAVSAAFNMLAASRLADNSDELMTLAREMIRPLLRNWIDDNLPSMVERMVRAEIERVARGGR